jgi:6-phospho-beta-glucosidase
VTVRQAAALLDKDPNRARWSYIGLNHRGFIVGLSWNGQDRTIDLVRRLGNNTLGGVRGSDILSLGVLPTKYYGLYSRPQTMLKRKSRAIFLSGLRKRILKQMMDNPRHSPSALCERYMDWYPDAVVPMVTALSSSIPSLQELNIVTSNGLAEEGRALISKNEVKNFSPARVSTKAARWIERFRRHERAVLVAVEKPSLESIIQALKLDPIMSQDKVNSCAQRIWNEMKGKRL